MTYKELLQRQREERDLLRRKNLAALSARFGSVSALAAALGRSSQQINNMLNGKKSFGDTITRYIEEKLNLGQGFFDTDPDRPRENHFECVQNPPHRVPLISFVQAGQLTDTGDLVADEWVMCYGEPSKYTFALRIKGDSMTPVFDEGDIVIVDDTRAPTVGDYVVAKSGLDALEEATIKRYYITGYDEHGRETFELRPLNPNYPTMDSQQLKLKVVGVVTELIKRF